MHAWAKVKWKFCSLSSLHNGANGALIPPGVSTRFSFRLFLTSFHAQGRISPRAFFLLMLPLSQSSNTSILFLWVTPTSDTSSSIQPFLHRWSKGSDCTDRPWHPQSKSRWAKGWELGTHTTCFRRTESLLGFCETVALPAAEQTATEWAMLQEVGDWQNYMWRTKAVFQHGSWKILHSLLSEEHLRHLQEAPEVLVH